MHEDSHHAMSHEFRDEMHARSVGSLPSPAAGAPFATQAGALSPRLVNGHWAQALRAERNLGVLLWTMLAAVLVLVSV